MIIAIIHRRRLHYRLLLLASFPSAPLPLLLIPLEILFDEVPALRGRNSDLQNSWNFTLMKFRPREIPILLLPWLD